MPRKKGSGNKSNFVRANIALSNEEIVKKAAETGLGKLSLGIIYNVRSAAKKSSTPKSKKAAAAPVATASESTPVTPSAPAHVEATPARKARKKRGKGRASGKEKQAKAIKPAGVTAAAAGVMKPSDFVRAQPTNLSAREVQAMGAKQGIRFSAALVYVVRKAALKKRGLAQAAAVAEPTVKAKRGPKPKAPVAEVSNDAEREKTFLRLALDIGLARARDLLALLHQSVESFFASK